MPEPAHACISWDKYLSFSCSKLNFQGVSMGHYASEMDPNWGQPSASELKLSKVEDERIQALAQTLFRGFKIWDRI